MSKEKAPQGLRVTPQWTRRDILRTGMFLGGSVLLGNIIVGCGTKTTPPAGGDQPAAPAPQPQAPPAALTIGFNREFVSLDTKTYQFDAQLTVLRSIREGLTGLSSELAVVPLVAEEFESAGPSEWRFTLRDGIKYSDGTPVTIDDVETAINSFRDAPKFGFASQFPEWPVVEKLDARTFVLKTHKPFTNLPRLLSYITVIPAALNRNADVDDTPGTGPYRVVKFDKGAQTLELEPNPHYYGQPPVTPKVRTRFFAEDSVRIAALKTGEIDVADSILPDAAVELESDPAITVVRTPGTRLAHLTYNFRKPAGHPLTKPQVRAALTYAIDGDSIIKNILMETVSPLKGLIPTTLFGAATVGEYKYDPARAKALLAEAGYGNGLDLVIIWETGEFLRIPQVMEAVASMFQAVGVRTTLKEFPSGGDIGKWRSGEGGEWDILGNGYGNQTGDGLDTLRGIYGGTAEGEAERKTYHGYVQPAVADKLAMAAAEFDTDRRLALMAEAQQLAWATWPQAWGFTQNNITAYRKRVQGIQVTPTNSFNLAGVSVS